MHCQGQMLQKHIFSCIRSPSGQKLGPNPGPVLDAVVISFLHMLYIFQ